MADKFFDDVFNFDDMDPVGDKCASVDQFRQWLNEQTAPEGMKRPEGSNPSRDEVRARFRSGGKRQPRKER